MGEMGGGGGRSKLADQYLDRDMRSLEQRWNEGRDEMGPPADQY